jgi:hypothetical protein
MIALFPQSVNTLNRGIGWLRLSSTAAKGQALLSLLWFFSSQRFGARPALWGWPNSTDFVESHPAKRTT